MNLHELRREFDAQVRSGGLDEMEDLRDKWINHGWKKLSEAFVIPSLKRAVDFDSVGDVAIYHLPYDYGGTEVSLAYQGRRLDPVPEETLRLAFERRSGNMGSVRYYDLSGIGESDLLLVPNCTLTNRSPQVLTTSANALLASPYWVRFDPYVDAEADNKDTDGMVDPGDFGFQIVEGSFVSGTNVNLDRAYRGPGGTKFTMRVQPAEQPVVRVYGIPASSVADGFHLVYYARPRKLYNPEDVPEWPISGLAIVYMAISVALEWHHQMDLSTSFWSRAMSSVRNLQTRRKRSQILVSDITVGSVVGRKTGLHGINRTQMGSIGRYR